MTDQPRILAFAGSARKDSFNVKLVNIAAAGARAAGAEVTVLDLNDFPMPLFNQDLEAADGPLAAILSRAIGRSHSISLKQS